MSNEKVEIYILSGKKPTVKNKHLIQKNLKLCKLAYQIGNVFCMTPWYDFENEVLRWPLLNKIYATIFGLCLGVVLIKALLLKDVNVYRNNFDRILACFSEVISIVLTEFMILKSIFINKNVCKVYIRKIWKNVKEFTIANDSFAIFNIQFIVGHLFFIGVFTYKGYVWVTLFNHSYVSLPLISNLISAYYCFLPSLLASNQALMIKRKYEYLNSLVGNQITSGTSEKNIVDSLIDVGKNFRCTAELVGYYNSMFGWVAVFIFWHTIVELLRCPSLFLRVVHDPETFWTLFTSVLLTSVISLGESMYLILCCASTTSSGKRMVQICIKLQEKFEADSKPRNELFKLAEIARTCEPRFTAANFFVINKGTILGLVNIATTYLIVIVQFNGVLKEISSS